MGGWEQHLLPRLVALADGETVAYDERLAVGLDAPGKSMSRNHVGMAVAGEAVRAWRRGGWRAGSPPRPLAKATPSDLRWASAASRLTLYLRDELTNGLWGSEVLATTPHCEFHLAIAMFARLAAVESQDPELLRLTAEHCRALGRLCATLSDPTGEVLSAGVRVPLAKGGKVQKRPVHSALTEWWRYLQGKPTRVAKLSAEPMYVGLRLLREKWNEADDALGLDDVFCFRSPSAPPAVPMSRPVIIHRWPGGHQVEIPRRNANETGLTKGSANPNGTCDWLRATYGAGKRGASKVEFGTRWQSEPPPVPKGALRVEWGVGNGPQGGSDGDL